MDPNLSMDPPPTALPPINLQKPTVIALTPDLLRRIHVMQMIDGVQRMVPLANVAKLVPKPNDQSSSTIKHLECNPIKSNLPIANDQIDDTTKITEIKSTMEDDTMEPAVTETTRELQELTYIDMKRENETRELEGVTSIEMKIEVVSDDEEAPSPVKRKRNLSGSHSKIWKSRIEKSSFVKCPLCLFVTSEVEDMKSHYQICDQDISFASFKCNICQGHLCTEKELLEHKEKSHPRPVQESVPGEKSPSEVVVEFEVSTIDIKFISPEKKKRGRPPGSKNLPKKEDGTSGKELKRFKKLKTKKNKSNNNENSKVSIAEEKLNSEVVETGVNETTEATRKPTYTKIKNKKAVDNMQTSDNEISEAGNIQRQKYSNRETICIDDSLCVDETQTQDMTEESDVRLVKRKCTKLLKLDVSVNAETMQLDTKKHNSKSSERQDGGTSEPVKRKRGRPSKSCILLKDTGTTIQTINQQKAMLNRVIMEDIATLKQVRGRGRPRKIKIEIPDTSECESENSQVKDGSIIDSKVTGYSADDSISNENDSVPFCNSLGNENVDESVLLHDVVNDSSDLDDNISLLDIAVKNFGNVSIQCKRKQSNNMSIQTKTKRGRPPKLSKEGTSSRKQDVTIKDKSTVQSKRKRGRPRKRSVNDKDDRIIKETNRQRPVRKQKKIDNKSFVCDSSDIEDVQLVEDGEKSGGDEYKRPYSTLNFEKKKIKKKQQRAARKQKKTDNESLVNNSSDSEYEQSEEEDDESGGDEHIRTYSTLNFEKKKVKRRKEQTEVREEIGEDKYKLPHSIKSFEEKNRKKKQQKKDKESSEGSGSENVNEQVSCGKCNMEFKAKTLFRYHNIHKHNNTAWLVGESEIPESQHMFLMMKALSVKKKVHCEKCDKVFTTILGYKYHADRCGVDVETLNTKCPDCGRVLKKSYLELHQRTTCEKIKIKKSPVITAELNSISRIKRKAADKALSNIQKVLTTVGDTENGEAGEEYGAKETDSSDGNREENESSPQNLYIVRNKKLHPFLIGRWKKQIESNATAKCNNMQCQFKSPLVEELRAHFVTCEYKPSVEYRCRICKLIENDESVMIEHVKFHDDTDVSSTSDLDVEKNIESVKKKKRKERDKTDTSVLVNEEEECAYTFLKCGSEVYPAKYPWKVYLPAIEWTCAFQLENYSKFLFGDWHSKKSDYDICNINDVKILYSKTKTSMSFRIQRAPKRRTDKSSVLSTQTLDLFGGSVINGFPTFFTGGPIKCMSWYPVPPTSKTVDNYLAVSSTVDPDNVYNSKFSYYESTTIQLWKIKALNVEPLLRLILLVPSGPVWDLQWCPSGTRDSEIMAQNDPTLESRDEGPNSKNESIIKSEVMSQNEPISENKQNTTQTDRLTRFGLLACACADGAIRIFSICDPDELETDEEIVVCRQKPSVILRLFESEFAANVQCMKISWCKSKNHNLMAGGFSNGLVGVWNISTKANWMQSTEDGMQVIYPYKTFRACLDTVTAIDLWPQSNSHYLLTGSRISRIQIWDLHDTSLPVGGNKMDYITCGVWPINWASVIAGQDDAARSNCSVNHIQIHNEEEASKGLLSQNCPVWDVTFSDWMNTLVYGSHEGDVLVNFCKNMLFFKRDQHARKVAVLSYTQLCELSTKKIVNWTQDEKQGENDHKVPKTYEEATSRYGLVINEIALLQPRTRMPENSYEITRQLDMPSTQPPHIYPITTVNKVSWNPNVQNPDWLAVGYNCGLLRIIQVNGEFSNHTDSMYSKAFDKLRDKFMNVN